MATGFSVGDTVALKSGGPTMTIEAQRDAGYFVCQWFDKNDKLVEGVFPAASLVPILDD